MFALAVPEAHEGLGPLPVELAVAFIEAGRHAVPGPLVETVAAAALLGRLARDDGGDGGDNQEAAAWLPRIAAGKATVSLNVPALAAEQVGAAARCLELTVAYAGERVQFGRPIGSFQAVKHRLADACVRVESARSAALGAAFAAADGARGPELTRLAATAKSVCSEAFSEVAGEMIQLHGGIGITWEHDAHRYFKRAHGSSRLFGPPHWHRARLAAVLGLPGPVPVSR
ncbi:hypothetical protein GCM10010282_49620 [Streptomyces roseolus]|nr:hypothetical protein GCM10010282_49620 [Streptomyces roseolus]